MSTRRIIEFLAAALIVIMLGGLAGWYFVIKQNISDTESSDSARGFGTDAAFGSPTGSTYQNVSDSFGITSSNGSSTPGKLAPKLWRVSQAPTAGFGFASSSRMYFAERSSGNILSADPSTSVVARLTNTLFPKIYEALFAADGSAILRSIAPNSTITTYAGSLASTTPTLDTDAPPQSLTGLYLPQNITAISVRGKQIAYFVENPDGGVVGATSDWRGASQKKIFASALSEWKLEWLSDNRMIVAQKASDGVTGYAFELKGGALQPLAVGPGLAVRARANSDALLFSTSSGGTVTLYARARANASSVALSISTTADKCAWAPGTALVAYCAVPKTLPSAEYLFNWYRGAFHSVDTLWRVDVSAGSATQLYAPEPSLALDVENIQADPAGGYIAFMNASDKSLWMLRISP